MKNLLLTVGALLTINSLTIAQNSTTDFRGFNWGSSFTQVKSNEKAKPWDINDLANNKDDILFYDDQLAGSDVTVIYQFNDNDKLINGTYIFGKKYSDPQLYLQDYEKFKGLLTQKYGKPASDAEEWSSNTTPFVKENYGQAICDGYLDLITVWSTDNSIIKVVLLTLNNRPSLQIHHTAKKLNELENKEELKTALPKL
jgi:hypothetical protein